MALSNIFQEPRREITESAIGLALFGVAVWGDYRFGCFYNASGYGPVTEGMVAGALVGILLFMVLVVIAYATHAIGESVCNAAQAMGIHLRPRVRR
jgi:hypothetical protein